MISKSTPELLAFFKEWLAWAESPDADSDNHLVFNNGIGLCGNLENWLDDLEHENSDTMYQISVDALAMQFVTAGLCKYYPFGEAAYDHHMVADTMHKDENRLAWVRARIADMENE